MLSTGDNDGLQLLHDRVQHFNHSLKEIAGRQIVCHEDLVPYPHLTCGASG
jgi:hypothetical protein